jgi:hypothetical protein
LLVSTLRLFECSNVRELDVRVLRDDPLRRPTFATAVAADGDGENDEEEDEAEADEGYYH